jgi:hypothetical protein
VTGSSAVLRPEGESPHRADYENDGSQARDGAAEALAMAERLAALFGQIEHRCHPGIIEFR